MKIGILGGTFDPIHESHLALAREAKNQFQLDKVLFVPALIPPFKTLRPDLTPAPYRYRMVELAIREEPDFEISDVELSRKDVSYTVDTLGILKEKYPNHELFLIMGQDSFSEIPTWKDPEKIRGLAGFLVARREGIKVKDPVEGKVQWIHRLLTPISSSSIREQIRQGKALGEGVLPKSVEQYIQRMNFYREG